MLQSATQVGISSLPCSSQLKLTWHASINSYHSQSVMPCVFARSSFFNMTCLCSVHPAVQRSSGTLSLLFRYGFCFSMTFIISRLTSYNSINSHHSTIKQVFMRINGLWASAPVITGCFMQQPWLQAILVCLRDIAHPDLVLT